MFTSISSVGFGMIESMIEMSSIEKLLDEKPIKIGNLSGVGKYMVPRRGTIQIYQPASILLIYNDFIYYPLARTLISMIETMIELENGCE